MRMLSGIAVIAMLAALAACGNQLPVGPSRVPSHDPALAGDITVTSITPAGTSLAVEACNPLAAVQGGLCSASWRATFDVTSPRDVADALLSVSFFAGGVDCGETYSPRQSVFAGKRVTFAVNNRISLTYLLDDPTSDENIFVLPCPLPTTTTRLLVRLWEGGSTPVVTKRFDYEYSFAQAVR